MYGEESARTAEGVGRRITSLHRMRSDFSSTVLMAYADRTLNQETMKGSGYLFLSLTPRKPMAMVEALLLG